MHINSKETIPPFILPYNLSITGRAAALRRGGSGGGGLAGGARAGAGSGGGPAGRRLSRAAVGQGCEQRRNEPARLRPGSKKVNPRRLIYGADGN
jgi:hypothetical protein